MRISPVAAVCCLLLAAGSARADEDETEASTTARAEHPFAVNLSVGVGTEFGILTIDRQWSLANNFKIEAGVGIGLAGFKARVLPKLEARLSNHGWITLGAGLVFGQHRWIEQSGWCWDDTCAEKRTSEGLAATTTASVEYRGSSNWRFGPYVGADVLLNPSTLECAGPDESIDHCERDHADDGKRRSFAGLRFTRMF